MRCLTARVRFVEGLPAELLRQAVEQRVAEHSEQQLLAFACGHLRLRKSGMLEVRTDAEKYDGLSQIVA